MAYTEYLSLSEVFGIKTQVVLRFEETLVALARRRSGRDNQSLEEVIDGLLADTLLSERGSRSLISPLDDDFVGAVALDDNGAIDEAGTERLHRLLGPAAP